MALDDSGIRSALRADPTGSAEGRLRMRARSAAEEIAAAAGDEYRAYLAAERAVGRPGSGATEATGWLLVVVLAPLVAAVAATVLLLLGYVLRLTAPAVEFGGPVITAGWTLASVAAVTGGLSVWVLLRTALGQRGERSVARARERWRRALLERGVLPYLRGQLPDSAGL
nr:hypothetical protein [Streptomyces sp. SID13726]